MFSQVGETVFFWHPKHAWIIGELKAVNESKMTATVKAADPKRGVLNESIENVKFSQVVPLMGGFVDEDVEDLMALTVLHDSTLLRCLFLRYVRDHIYTNIGAILVAMNPFTFSIPWYQDECMADYLNEGPRVETKLPHTWAVTHGTYHELILDNSAQFILVSGESGSGKTEACKIVMKYLSAVSSRHASPNELEACQTCGSKLIKSSPILESFGNARTLRNDNSSRFGKFMKIHFTETGVLAGAHTTRYLLEKSRIVSAAKQERVFHAFYLLLRGPYKSSLGLMEDKQYVSLNSGGLLNNTDFDTAQHFEEVVVAMRTVGMTQKQVDAVWATTAGIITMLNATFDQIDGGTAISKKGMEYVTKAAALWCLEAQSLADELTRTILTIKGEETVRRFSMAEAKDARDALCKALYDSLFGWLVERCNELCICKDVGVWIGLLDIFGFEDFDYNSFEQLCINLTNETLQGHYNEYVFAKDIEECRAEGINTASIICPDNTPCLDMVASMKTSVFTLLDDQCFVGDGTDKRFGEAVTQQYGNHPFFVKNKFTVMSFGVRHYAGSVTYEVANWLEKNRDSLRDSVRNLMRGSTEEIVASLLGPPVDMKGKKNTVSSVFRSQLNSLMVIVNTSNPHWIRCIKPHGAKKPRLFDGVLTSQQLESSGVLGTVKIRKAGYPVRILFERFVERFYLIYPTLGTTAVTKLKENSRAASERILMECLLLDNKRTQLGKTKIFMKSEALSHTERARTVRLNLLLTRIQKQGRGLIARRKVMRLLLMSRIQRLGRGLVARAEMGRLLLFRAASIILDEFRSFLVRTAEVRAARAKFLQEQREERIRVSGELLSVWENDRTAMCAQYAEERANFQVELITLCEPRGRLMVLQDEKVHRGQAAILVGLNFVEKTEDINRAGLQNGPMARTRCLMLLEYVEEMLRLLIAFERDSRRVIACDWTCGFFDSAKSSTFRALLLRLCVVEAASRKKIENQQIDAINGNIVAPFYRHTIERVEFSWSHGSERQERWELVEEENRVRRQRAVFERKYLWRTLLLQTEHEEESNRSYIFSQVEPRARCELELQCMEWKRRAAAKDAIASFFMQERTVRTRMWAVQQEARESLRKSFATLRFYIFAGEVENEELKFRLSIVSAEATLRELFARERMSARVACAVSDVLMSEAFWRRRLAQLEAKQRFVFVQHGHAQLRVFARECLLRDIIQSIFLHQLSEISARSRIDRDDANMRHSFINARREGVLDLVRAAQVRDSWEASRALQRAVREQDEARYAETSADMDKMSTVQLIQDEYYAMPSEDRNVHRPVWDAVWKLRRL